MKITVKVKTKAREQKVEKVGENIFAVWVKEPAEKGKANMAVVKVLSAYFKTSQNKVRIVSGLSSHQKVIIINNS